MPFAPKTVVCPPFGVLRAEGRSKVWEGELALVALGGTFSARIHGDTNGPTQKQAALAQSALTNAMLIKQQATDEVCSFLKSAGVVPNSTFLSAENVWDFLQASLLEIHPECYLGPEHLALSLGYEIPRDKANLLWINIINGLFSDVSSGT